MIFINENASTLAVIQTCLPIKELNALFGQHLNVIRTFGMIVDVEKLFRIFSNRNAQFSRNVDCYDRFFRPVNKPENLSLRIEANPANDNLIYSLIAGDDNQCNILKSVEGRDEMIISLSASMYALHKMYEIISNPVNLYVEGWRFGETVRGVDILPNFSNIGLTSLDGTTIMYDGSKLDVTEDSEADFALLKTLAERLSLYQSFDMFQSNDWLSKPDQLINILMSVEPNFSFVGEEEYESNCVFTKIISILKSFYTVVEDSERRIFIQMMTYELLLK